MAPQTSPADREQPAASGTQPTRQDRNQTVFASVHGHAQAAIVPRPAKQGQLRPHAS